MEATPDMSLEPKPSPESLAEAAKLYDDIAAIARTLAERDALHDAVITERNLLRGDNALAQKLIAALEQQLGDWHDDAARVLNEDCPPDEAHCTCVPHLRARVQVLERAMEFASPEPALPRDPLKPRVR